MQDIKEALKKAVASKTGTEKLKKNGGARPGSGRKPKEEILEKRGVTALVEQHINEEVEVEVIVKGKAQKITIKKPRIIIALEKLYEIGTAKGGSHEALGKWLDRALGKPVQQIAGDQEKPIRLILDF